MEQVHALYQWWYILPGTRTGNGTRKGTANRDPGLLFPIVPVLFPVLSPVPCTVNKPWVVLKPTEQAGFSFQIFKKETSKQESIPVGCTPPTHHHWEGFSVGGVSLTETPCLWTETSWTETPLGTNMGPKTDPSKRNMEPSSQTGSDIIQRPPWTDRRLWKDYLAQNFADGNKRQNPDCSNRWDG